MRSNASSDFVFSNSPDCTLLPAPTLVVASRSSWKKLTLTWTRRNESNESNEVERRAPKMSSQASWISGDDRCGPRGVQAQGIRHLSPFADACWHADSVNVPVHIVDFWCLSCGSGDANEFPGANTGLSTGYKKCEINSAAVYFLFCSYFAGEAKSWRGRFDHASWYMVNNGDPRIQ